MKGGWKRKVAMILSLVMILASFDVQASANSSIGKQKDSSVIAPTYNKEYVRGSE